MPVGENLEVKARVFFFFFFFFFEICSLRPTVQNQKYFKNGGVAAVESADIKE